MEEQEQSSSGHKLGQLVGDWFQDWFVSPLLQEVANYLGLYLDHRRLETIRTVRGDRILWADTDNNEVDYDFVLELGGAHDVRGIPLAFFECFWRRGSRHSKDKARDDSGKLMPMRIKYATARFLGIVASGEFTKPARELIESRRINLFYVPKSKVIETFQKFGLEMDYHDKAPEEQKAKIAKAFQHGLTAEMKAVAAAELRKSIGEAAIAGYIATVQGALSAAPLEFRIIGRRLSAPAIFDSIDGVSAFLENSSSEFDWSSPTEEFSYQITYNDGTDFEQELSSITDVKELHQQIALLTHHMEAQHQKLKGQ